MKKFLLVVVAVASITAYGQNQLVTTEAQVGDSTRTKPWKNSGIYSFSVAQTSLTNWAAGGNNNVNINFLVKELAVYSKNKWTWNNLFEANFGYNYQTGNTMKTDDRLEFTTRIDRDLGSQDWRLSFLANIRTQFIDGFTNPNDVNRISTFMAPGYLTYGLGLTNKSIKGLGIYFSPIQVKSTFVLDSSLFAANQFFNSTGPNITTLAEGGMRTELGAFLDIFYKTALTENLEIASRLNLFSNYLDRPQNVDVNWELIAKLKAWKVISVLFTVNMIYDHDVLVQNPDANGQFRSPATQWKQILGVGLAYSFGEYKK